MGAVGGGCGGLWEVGRVMEIYINSIWITFVELRALMEAKKRYRIVPAV